MDLYPDHAANHKTNEFTYADDQEGVRCPLGAHVRRTNPRNSLGFSGHIISRRRMIRRGIAYGDFLSGAAAPDAPRGIMFLAFNASIERQFEFTQKQWINYGDEFEQGDDSDPIAGARYGDGRPVDPEKDFERGPNTTGRMMIPGDARTGRLPFLCSKIPRFVTTRGGDYFFVPSMTGLRLLASGQVSVK